MYMQKISATVNNVYQHIRKTYSKRILILTGIVIIGIIFLIVRSLSNSPTPETVVSEPSLDTVTLISSLTYQANSTNTIIGTASAKTEATLQSERGGRITSAPVTLGQRVTAGTIIVQFENASERAAVTQARGAYEAAVAAASQSTLSISDAENAVIGIKNSLVTTHNSAYATISGIVTGSLDRFYANPNSTNPTLRISSGSNTTTLANSRIALQSSLSAWQNRTTTLSTASDLLGASNEAKTVINDAIITIDIFIAIFQNAQGDSQYSETEYRQLAVELSSTRNTLVALLDTFKSLELQLARAEENVTRAQLGGNQVNSLASAQITQARGGLQAAEANLAKTIIRSPITGTITSLSVKTGDFVGAFNPLAQVTNTNGIEVTTFVNESEIEQFAVGSPVIINNDITATVTNVSPTIDPNTRKYEVRIGVDDNRISSGSTVTITTSYTANPRTTTIIIPLSALRYIDSEPHVLQVSDNKLIATKITLGPIRGDSVTVTEGISYDTLFVRDARGKTIGTEVTATE